MKSNKNFRKDDLSPEGNTKKIYKMYKRKKQWVVAPVVMALLLNAGAPVALAVTDLEQQDISARAVDKNVQELIDQAITNVEALKSLQKEAKDEFILELTKAEDTDTVETIIKKAYVADVQQTVNDTKTSYDEKITVLASLIEEEQTDFKNKIAALKLDDLAIDFKNSLEAKGSNSTDYSVYKAAFDEALKEKMKAADEIVAEAVALDAVNADFSKYIEEQQAIIRGLNHINEVERELLCTQIGELNQKDEVDQIVENAKKKNQEKLTNAISKKVEELKTETAKLEELDSSKKLELDAKIDEASAGNDDAALANLNLLVDEIAKAIEDATATDVLNKLNEAKSTLKAKITKDKKEDEGNSNLITAANVKDFNKKVDAAKTIEEVNAVAAEWAEFIETISLKNKNLKDAKTEGEALIEKLPTIDPSLKANYQADVQLAKTQDEIIAIVTKAQKAEREAVKQKETELKTAKAQAIKDIKGLTNLTADQKESMTKEVETATELSEINELVKTAKEEDASAALANEKTAAQNKVGGLEFLSSEDKDSAKAKIADATDSAGITKALNEAIYNDYQAGVASADVTLDTAKEIAKEAVNKLENLTAGQKTAALKDINKATEKTTITEVLEKAKELDQANIVSNEAAKNLEKLKEDARMYIDEMKYLSTEVKEGFKAEITKAKDGVVISAILSKAIEENTKIENQQNEFEQKKKDLVTKINASSELTADDKKELIAQAIDCSTVDEVDTLEAKVDQLILDRTIANVEEAEAKSKIKEAIGSLDKLTNNQIQAYKDRVEKLEKKADMVEVYEEAKAENDRVADKMLVNNIDQMIASGSYVEAQKEINKLRVDKTREECQAKLDKSIAVTEAKAAANKQIDALENLAAKEKAEAKEKVAGMTSVEKIEEYVAELVKANNSAHDKDIIELAKLQIKAKEFDKAAETIERIRDEETKAKLKQELEDAQKVAPTVKAKGHVSKLGWQNAVDMNEVIGTVGRKLALEAVKINLSDVEIPEAAQKLVGGIEYRVHVKDKGWMKYVSNGELAGTVGQSLQMEAIQIKLTGELAKKYDVEYRAHIQDKGWMKYVSNGAKAGTTGQSLRMEALQIRLVEKK